MTLKTQIAADASAVFLNEDDFATEVTRWVGGESDNTETVLAVVELDDEMGTNEAAGEGRHIADQTGLPLLRSCKLEITAAKAAELRPEKDVFVLEDGSQFVFARVLGRDDAMATVLCFRSESVSRKITRPRQ